MLPLSSHLKSQVRSLETDDQYVHNVSLGLSLGTLQSTRSSRGQEETRQSPKHPEENIQCPPLRGTLVRMLGLNEAYFYFNYRTRSQSVLGEGGSARRHVCCGDTD